METYDTVQADQLEVGDFISIDGEPVEIRDILDTPDPDAVSLRVYSHEDNDTKTVDLPFDYDVDLLGA